MSKAGLLAVIVLAALPRPAAALAIERVVIVGQGGPDQPWSSGATEARRDDRPRLAAVVVVRDGRARRYVAPAAARPLEIDGRRIPAGLIETPDVLPGASVTWSLVEPHAWRRPGTRASNGATARYHSNVSTEAASFGAWLGYDQLEYFETALAPSGDGAEAWLRPARARPSDRALDRHDGLGTVHYKVAVTLADGRAAASPGAETVDRYGLGRAVHRVSLRADDTVRGFLGAYFLVPEVFGSAGPGRDHQTDRFTGADCADVMTGALRRAGYGRVEHTNVASLGRYGHKIAGPAELGPDSGRLGGVEVGDLVRIDYGGALAGHTPRSWDHVAMMWQDRSDPAGPAGGGPDGALDGFDLVVHMGHPRLEVEPLAEQLPATIDVLRLDGKKLGPRRAQRGKRITTGR